jgi:hypothetical protein
MRSLSKNKIINIIKPKINGIKNPRFVELPGARKPIVLLLPPERNG